jgi:hypothetical protein
MSEVATQVRGLSTSVAGILRRLIDLAARVARLEQLPWATSANAGGGSTSSGIIYYCVPSANMGTASANPPTATVPTLAGQTIYRWTNSGGYSAVTTSGTIVNTSNVASVTSGLLAYVMPNPDSTYTVITQPQTCGG